MTELEELKKQKKEIEAKIRALENREVSFGRTKIAKVRYYGGREPEWIVSVKRKAVDFEDKERFFPIIVAHDKQKVIDEIDVVIENLKGLRDKLKGDRV